MARKNKLGTSFCSLELEQEEERIIKMWLEKKGINAKQMLRYLVRKLITEEKLK